MSAGINANQLSGDKGPYVLIQKLTQKGVPKSTIEENLKEFDFSEVAQRVANKLLKKYEGKLPARALQDKIIQNMTNNSFRIPRIPPARLHSCTLYFWVLGLNLQSRVGKPVWQKTQWY